MRHRKILAALAAMALASTLLTGRPAQAGGDGNGDGNASGTPGVSGQAWAAGRGAHGPGVTAAQAVTAYWTPERMRAARPVEESPAYLKALGKPQPAITAEKEGEPRSTPPSRGILTDLGVDAVDPGFSPTHPTASTSGKAFLTINGSDYGCSGTIINGPGGDTVWTAGHCVHTGEGGNWVDNWAFVPAYDDDLANPRPFGTWTAVQLWSRTAWMNSSLYAQDMGVAIMATDANGDHIVHLLGAQGLTTNRGLYVQINSFGYPAETRFDGGNLWRCSGPTGPENPLFPTTTVIRMRCDMNRGSSGGGWLWGWDGAFGQLYGVISFGEDAPNTAVHFSPYFNGNAWSLHTATRDL